MLMKVYAESARQAGEAEDTRLQRRRLPRKHGIICSLVVAAAALALLFAGLQWLDGRSQKPETRGDLSARYEETQVEFQGETYRLRSNLTAILFLGIDQAAREPGEADGRSGGNADFLRLVVVDSNEKTVSQIQIDRDTVAMAPTLNLIGQRTDAQPMQIALSHSFGDGKNESCELTVEAVSGLLLIPINAIIHNLAYYAALNLDGIEALNDFVGGVTVTVEDDFSGIDPAMVQGTSMRLTGKQAETFVRNRRDLPVGTNEARMARQQAYLTGMIEIIQENLKQDKEYIGRLFDALSPYLVTNLSRAQMVNTAWKARDYGQQPLRVIPGSRRIGGTGYAEFIPDEEALRQIILSVFYRKL